MALGLGIIGDLVIGILGAFVENWLLPQLGIYLGTDPVAGNCQYDDWIAGLAVNHQPRPRHSLAQRLEKSLVAADVLKIREYRKAALRIQSGWTKLQPYSNSGLDRMYDLKNGGFLPHRILMENEDETEICTTLDILRTRCERHPPDDKRKQYSAEEKIRIVLDAVCAANTALAKCAGDGLHVACDCQLERGQKRMGASHARAARNLVEVDSGH